MFPRRPILDDTPLSLEDLQQHIKPLKPVLNRIFFERIWARDPDAIPTEQDIIKCAILKRAHKVAVRLDQMKDVPEHRIKKLYGVSSTIVYALRDDEDEETAEKLPLSEDTRNRVEKLAKFFENRGFFANDPRNPYQYAHWSDFCDSPRPSD